MFLDILSSSLSVRAGFHLDLLVREVLRALDFFVREMDSFSPARREDWRTLACCILIFWKGGEFSPLFNFVEIYRYEYFQISLLPLTAFSE